VIKGISPRFPNAPIVVNADLASVSDVLDNLTLTGSGRR